jgi:hypothetical protein
VFNFLEREHPNVLSDMKERIAGDDGEQWVREALEERLAAYEEVNPAESLGEYRRVGQSTTHRDMNKRHILYWMFNFLEREHPNVLSDMKERIAGDDGDQSVREALEEYLAAYGEVKPAGYKFHGEFRRVGQSTTHRDIVVAQADLKTAEAKASEHLSGADKITMIALSKSDLANMNLKEGQVRK